MSIPADIISCARAADIAVVARAAGAMLKGKRHLSGPCPRCGGTDRFAIDPYRQLFNCRGCGGHGHGAIDFVQFLHGCDFGEAVEILGGRLRSTTKTSWRFPSVRKPALDA